MCRNAKCRDVSCRLRISGTQHRAVIALDALDSLEFSFLFTYLDDQPVCIGTCTSK